MSVRETRTGPISRDPWSLGNPPGWPLGRSSTTFDGMNARARQLLDELLQLSAEDRALIADELDASLDVEDERDATPEEVERAWAEEIERRVQDVLEGRSHGRPAADAIAEIRARLHAARVR